ncbi:hypothetical protein KY334_01985 [Candidatus Woesearchaeota archaeon]|nr:hypothetical protein [Candidatus Woesearchaeota archaeon]
MAFWNKEQPLGIPEGSVRALLALSMIVFTFWYFWLFKEIPKELVGLDTFVITYYFTKRDGYNRKVGHWKLRYKLNEQSRVLESVYSAISVADAIDKLKQDYQNNETATNIVIEHYERLD